MKTKSKLRILRTVLATFGIVFSAAVLMALGLFFAVSCTTTRTAPAPAYRFKPGPSYLPGAKPYVHERYPNHP
jgi:hypothetical protein